MGLDHLRQAMSAAGRSAGRLRPAEDLWEDLAPSLQRQGGEAQDPHVECEAKLGSFEELVLGTSPAVARESNNLQLKNRSNVSNFQRFASMRLDISPWSSSSGCL
jgi:hypothetical protein